MKNPTLISQIKPIMSLKLFLYTKAGNEGVRNSFEANNMKYFFRGGYIPIETATGGL